MGESEHRQNAASEEIFVPARSPDFVMQRILTPLAPIRETVRPNEPCISGAGRTQHVQVSVAEPGRRPLDAKVRRRDWLAFAI